MSPEITLIPESGKITREQLALVPTPLGTATHRPIPHIEVVNALVDTLGFRHIAVVKDEYAVDRTGMKMFGVMEIDQGTHGVRLALGLRNSHDKTFSLAITVGYRVFVCSNLAFSGDYSPVLAKHTKNFSLTAALSVGVDDMQRNFRPMIERVNNWRQSIVTPEFAKLQIYRAFIEGELEAPKHLARVVHQNFFEPKEDEFLEPSLWSLENAFTGALKELEPLPMYRATASLGRFMQAVRIN